MSVSCAKEVTLVAPNNGEFQTGKWYYISLLPKALEKGFSMTFINRTDEIGGSGLYYAGSNGYYWSGTFYGDYHAWYLRFNSDDVYMYSIYRCYGFSVRPVTE